MLGVAAAQFAPTDDRARNLAEIEGLARLAAERGAGLVVFPEYSSWFVPELGPAWLDHAEPESGPFVAGLGRIADDLGVHLVAGMAGVSSEPGKVSNQVVAVAPDAGVVATYRKLHLYDAFGGRESDWVEAGDLRDPQLFEVSGFRVGLQTCYDLRFPEVTRWLVDAGAEVVLMPAEWVRGPLKESHWDSLIKARAIENTVWLAAADHPPKVGVGHSMVVDPMGVQLASVGEEPRGVALAWLDRERLREVRTTNPSLRLRRFRVEPGPPATD
ncbi:carbon-nitrogen hydrolase family protein [Aestuariimicrobium kwangyangense]|uniref:carbon-nitrogen hydrolase family protein n=1 Tax=Aestuariimicrobium kwangyangense TaxID=396389 RepID=UPI0003B5A433|nr:carbon-nitrogen hydrolase family protein [Aestuariimicrobium kwangyangense]